MKLRSVVRRLDSAVLTAVIEDGGRFREIRHTWKTRSGAQAPVPVRWFKSICAEVRDARRKEGLLPADVEK